MSDLVVLVADTLRVPEKVPGLQPSSAMPFLTRLAKDGTTFPRAVASSPWTVPSHACLLQGVEPWEVHYHTTGLEVPESPSVATVWGKEGGEAVAFSANGLISPVMGTLQGYAAYNPGAWNRRIAPWVWRALGRFVGSSPELAADEVGGFSPERPSEKAPPSASALTRGRTRLFNTGVHALTNGRGIEAGLSRWLRRRRDARPLHVFVNLMEAHEPYDLPSPPRGEPLPRRLQQPMMGLAPHSELISHAPGASGLVREAYRRSLTRLDRRIEGLFGVMARQRFLRDTHVLLVSDHGQGLGEQGFFGHGHVLQDPVVQVPCWAWHFRDGQPTPSGASVGVPFDHRHLHDALVGLSQGDVAEVGPGVERALAARGPAVSYWEGPETRGTRANPASDRSVGRSLRLFRDDESLEVSDLGEDAGRVHLLSAGAGELRGIAKELLDRSATQAPRRPAVTDGDVQARLRSWGYV